MFSEAHKIEHVCIVLYGSFIQVELKTVLEFVVMVEVLMEQHACLMNS